MDRVRIARPGPKSDVAGDEGDAEVAGEGPIKKRLGDGAAGKERSFRRDCQCLRLRGGSKKDRRRGAISGEKGELGGKSFQSPFELRRSYSGTRRSRRQPASSELRRRSGALVQGSYGGRIKLKHSLT